MHTVLRVVKYLKRYPGLAAGALICALLSRAMLLVYPDIARKVIDEVVIGGDISRLKSMTIIAFAAFLARDVLNALRIFFNNFFEQNVIYDLRSDLYEHLQKLPLRWFDNRPSGDIMTRVSEDVVAMERVLIDGVEQGAAAAFQVILVSVALFYTNWQIALAALTIMPLQIIGARIYTHSARFRYKAARKAAGRMNSILHDNMAGIRQIRAYAAEKEEHKRFNRYSESFRQATLKVMRAWAFYSSGMSFLGGLGLVIVLAYSGKIGVEGKISPGEIAEFIALLAFLYEPIERLHGLNQIIQAGKASAERVFEVIDVEPEATVKLETNITSEDSQTPLTKKLAAGKGNIVYKNVNFRYKKSEVKDNRPDRVVAEENSGMIRNINLEIPAGHNIALVGPTGAGKSTIVNLLPRFYEYDSGSISIGGICIKDVDPREIRRHIGYVTQESFLFNGTVRDNLLIGKRDANDDELQHALEVARGAEFVNRLDKKLDAVVGERGVKLSVGEKQRLAIARAILKDPPILLLDEATASVDNHTERLIQEALGELLKERTSLVIAHRLSTVRKADKIVVIESGKIREVGTHDELMVENGVYAELIRLGESTKSSLPN